MFIARITALAAVPLLLAACAGNGLQTAEQFTPQGNEFERQLHANYVDVARAEHAQGDYRDSDKYAERAVAAGSGATPEPEALAERDLPRSHRDDLAAARERLLAAFANGARETSPDRAARAQVMFDCWLEQQEENFQPEHIAACRDGFDKAMSDLDARMAAAPAPAVSEVSTRVYGVRFDFDSDALRDDAEPVLRDLLAQLENSPETMLRVRGHADALGGEGYNHDLSQRRAQSVANWLVANGVSAARVAVEAYGELLPVADNDTEEGRAENRRADLTIGD